MILYLIHIQSVATAEGVHVIGNATIYGNMMAALPEVNCTQHNQRVRLRSLALNF